MEVVSGSSAARLGPDGPQGCHGRQSAGPVRGKTVTSKEPRSGRADGQCSVLMALVGGKGCL